MKALKHFNSLQLEKIHRGKVRDSFRIDGKRRMIVVTDRISAFNKNLKNAIPHKGGVLNTLTNFWFEKTGHIIDNHLIEQIDDNISIVKEAEPIRVEMIVRAYLTGYMWRVYQSGGRELSGVKIPDGLTVNHKFPEPILTPTTKDKDDTNITEKEIIRRGLVDEHIYRKMKETAMKLFNFGSRYLDERGIILVDTKYEFGLSDGKLILIDEIHTPDSSRFWYKSDYEKSPAKVEQIDKEFVRQWMLANKVNGELPTELPETIVMETSRRYREIFQIITGHAYQPSAIPAKMRTYYRLLEKTLIKPGVVVVITSRKEIPGQIKNTIGKTEVFVKSYTPDDENRFVDEINNAIEPVVVVDADGSNKAWKEKLAVPVISINNQMPDFDTLAGEIVKYLQIPDWRKDE